MPYYYELRSLGGNARFYDLEKQLDDFRRARNPRSFRDPSIPEVSILSQKSYPDPHSMDELTKIVSDIEVPTEFFEQGEVVEGPIKVDDTFKI